MGSISTRPLNLLREELTGLYDFRIAVQTALRALDKPCFNYSNAQVTRRDFQEREEWANRRIGIIMMELERRESL